MWHVNDIIRTCSCRSWLEKQPTPRDMDDASDIRGPNGELKDYVEALHYVESGELNFLVTS